MYEKRLMRDVAYASGAERQKLDIYLPEGEGPHPAIILLHGGAFRFGSRTMPVLEPIFRAPERGFALISADYRTADEAKFPGPLADVKAAVRWVRANAGALGVDPGRIALWGESAGGYLALMTALTPEVRELDGDVHDNAGFSSAANALVTYYPLVDFCTLKRDAEDAGFPEDYCGENSCESLLMGFPVADDAPTRRSLWESYVNYLPENFRLPTLIQVGDADRMVPYMQSVDFAEKLTGRIGRENVTLEVFPGAGHIAKAFFAPENLDRVYRFLSDALN